MVRTPFILDLRPARAAKEEKEIPQFRTAVQKPIKKGRTVHGNEQADENERSKIDPKSKGSTCFRERLYQGSSKTTYRKAAWTLLVMVV
jgi:hypothetical protein